MRNGRPDIPATLGQDVVDELAREQFRAYVGAVGGSTHDGRPIPPWEMLTPTIQQGWKAGALRVLERAFDMYCITIHPRPRP